MGPALILLALLAQTGSLPVIQRQNRRPAAEPAPPRAEVKPEDRCTVEGTVLNARTSEPVRKAQVMLVRTDPPQGDYTPQAALTDTAGHFRFAAVDPGRYRISFWRSGFARPEMERRRPGDAPATVTLAARQTLKDLVFKLSPAAVITGRVLDEDGDPVTSAQVQALRFRYMQGRRQLMPVGYASSDDQGNYRMHSLPAGRYYVRVSHPGQRALVGFVSGDSAEADQGYAALYYPGVLDPSQAVILQVGEGEERRAIDFRLVPVRTVRVRGRILNPPTARGRGVMVSLQPRHGSLAGLGVGYAGAKPDGSFELRGIVPGSYVLWAQYAPDREHSLSARRPIEIGNANVENIEITLRPGAEVTGHVAVEGAADSKIPFEQMRIGLQRDMEQRSEAVAADGSFKLANISDGDYRVMAYNLPQDCYLKSVRLGGADAPENSITVSEGAVAGKLEVVISAAGGKLEGSVANDKHEALAGITVVLAPEGKPGRSDLFQNTQTDQNGRFSLRGLPPGDYLLFAWEEVETGAWGDPAFLEQYKDRGKRVTVGERTQQNVELSVIPAADRGK